MVLTIAREGLEGGSWDAIEERWTIPRYRALRRHFEENGPPIYSVAAAFAGIKLKPPGGGETIQDPDDLIRALEQLPGVTRGGLSPLI